MLDGTEYYECTCGAPDHTLRFILDHGNEDKDDTWPPTLYTEVMLSHFRPWHKRVWIGIKYMFGMETPDHYGGWELNREDADRLIKMLEDFKTGEVKYLRDKKLTMRSSKRCGWINDNGLYSGYEQESGDGC